MSIERVYVFSLSLVLLLSISIMPFALAQNLYCQIWNDQELTPVKEHSVACLGCDSDCVNCDISTPASCGPITCDYGSDATCCAEGTYSWYTFLGNSNDPLLALESAPGSGTVIYDVDFDGYGGVFCTPLCTGQPDVAWNMGGEISQTACCGDDIGEYPRTCEDGGSGICATAPAVEGCPLE